MRSEKEQHGHELGPETPQEYADYHQLAPQRPTFKETNKTGRKNAGHDKSWEDAAQKVSPQGDGKPGPVTPVSGGIDGDVVDPKSRSQYKYVTGGRKYSAEFGRVPDEGKVFEPSAPVGHPKMYANEGPQTSAFHRPIQLGWRKRYADTLNADAQVADSATAPNTPQRKRQRNTES